MQEVRGAQVAAEIQQSKLALFGIAIAVLVADQASKAWAVSALSEGRRIPIIGDTFDLRLVLNSGSAFGLFPNATLFITIASTLVIVAVVVWALRDPTVSIALGLVIGGGIGNLSDRILRPPGGGFGHVVDFIYLSFWPTFNVADSAICVGVGFLLLQAWREEKA